MSIDSSLEALSDALEATGVDRPRPPADPERLEQIDAAIAPLRLPAELRRFWERVDTATLRLWAFPHPIGPDFALESWLQQRDEFPGMAPSALFLVGYESWNCLSVELDSPFGRGGAVFEWRLDGGDFYLRHHQLADWINRMTDLLSVGAFVRRDGPVGPVVCPEDPDTELALSAQRDRLPSHPLYGEATSIEREVLRWPLRWQRLSGIEPADIAPRGATHSIAEVLASNPGELLEATIAGRVRDLASLTSTTRVRVDDGTGELAINCPTAVTALGPVCGKHFEFDVIVPAGERRRPADPDALAETGDAVKDLSNHYLARYGGPAGAVATAIRPLDFD